MARRAPLVEARREGLGPRRYARVTDPIAAYHALLEKGQLASSTAERLAEAQRTRRLMFGTRPLSVALRPQFLTPHRHEQAGRAAEGGLSAPASLERAGLEDAHLPAGPCLQPEE